MKNRIENQFSDEILMIVCEPPSWLMRAGSSVMAGIVLLFFIGTWVLKYPEVLKGSAIIRTQEAAIRVQAPSNGRLAKLLVKDGSLVKKGDVIAETENTMRLENIPAMQNILHQAKNFLKDNSNTIVFPQDSYVWGELQADFNLLRQAYLDFKRMQQDDYQRIQTENLKQQAAEMQQMAAYQERQKQLVAQSTNYASEAFQTDSKLYEEGISSKMEFIKSNHKFIEKQQEQEDINKALITTRLKIKELEKNIYDLGHTQLEKRRTCIDYIEQSLHNIENSLRNWQQNYLIKAPADGKLFFLKNLAENQFLKALDTLCAVMPAQDSYIALVDIPVMGMGKAAIGQKVIIKLDDYPYQEFGMLEGEVKSVFPSLNIRYYRVEVSLSKGLESTYQRKFHCRSELAGSAEIVTADLRMLERAFYGIRKLLM